MSHLGALAVAGRSPFLASIYPSEGKHQGGPWYSSWVQRSPAAVAALNAAAAAVVAHADRPSPTGQYPNLHCVFSYTNRVFHPLGSHCLQTRTLL
jgi:hypothetical protein